MPLDDLHAHVLDQHGFTTTEQTEAVNLSAWHARAHRGETSHTHGAPDDSHGTEVVDLSFPPDWKADAPQLETAVEAGASVTSTVVRASTPDPGVSRETPPDDDRPPTDPGLLRAWQRRRAANAPPDTPDEETPPPRLGAVVWFRSRTGRWTAPAVVTAVLDSLYQPNVEAGHLPPLTSDRHVHLTVLTPGRPGHVSDETRETHPELADPDRPNRPAGGTFQEWDIPQWSCEGAGIVPDEEGFLWDDQEDGTWMWPR